MAKKKGPAKMLPFEKRKGKAMHWVKTYEGNNIVKGYRKRFGVDRMSALHELKKLGVPITDKQFEDERKQIEARRRKKMEKKEKEIIELFDQDDYHYIIWGYTSGGASYGITWEEARELGWVDENNEEIEDSEMSWSDDDIDLSDLLF